MHHQTLTINHFKNFHHQPYNYTLHLRVLRAKRKRLKLNQDSIKSVLVPAPVLIMAAYAALVALMHTIDDIQNHHSPPISLHKQQVESLTQIVGFLQEFLKNYVSPDGDGDGDEADQLEMRIADAAYAVQDVIESHIVDNIQANESSSELIEDHVSSDGDSDGDEILGFLQELNKEYVSSDGDRDGDEIVGLLQEFLKNYVSPDGDGDEADPLEMRIADAAYAAQDVIESHIVDNIQANESSLELIEEYVSSDGDSDGDEILGFLRELFEHGDSDGDDPLKMHIADAAYAAQDAIEVDNIPLSSKNPNKKEETIQYVDVGQVMEELDLIKKELMEGQNSGMVIHDQSHRFISIPHVPTLGSSSSFSSVVGKNSGIVCSEDVLNGIKQRLVDDGQLDLQIIPIVGMGGIGKTTLAKTVYSDTLIKQRFEIRAWATISQQYNTRDILCELFSKATRKDKKELSGWTEYELGNAFYKHLFGKRFLVVMDDMWSVDAWDKIKEFFPKYLKKEDACSRVLVTTRLSQLSNQLNKHYNLHMKFLDEVSSWELLTKTLFGEESFPSELEKIGKEIVSNCRGLPLSIVVVGGLLKNIEHTLACWESVRKNLASVVNSDNKNHCLRLLKMSYNHLPIFLKPCFLYMGVFEEDDEIKVSTVVKLWIGEGFVKPIQGKSLEASAKVLLNELIDRNLLLSHTLGKTGNIKYCKIHDLLRDLCLKQGMKEGLYHVVGEQCPRGINSQRRLVIPRNTSEEEVNDALQSMPHARSIISEYGKLPQCQNYGLLKTLHAYKYRYYNDESYFNSLVFRQYVNLRHLAIEVHSMSSLFSSIHLIWNLHTLIVSSPRVNTSTIHQWIAPSQLWKLSHIRHIEFYGKCFSFPDPPSSGVVILENLHTLKGVLDFKFVEEVVQRIPNIKKLEIEYHGHKGTNHDDHYSLTNVKRLSKLETLHFSCSFYAGNVASLHHNLTFPHSLTKLVLSPGNRFEWKEPLEKIGLLPNLLNLRLFMGCFRGKWEIAEGQFPSLKFLSLISCFDLEHLAAAEDNFKILPRLEHLHLFHLPELKEITREIGEIPTLRKIDLIMCNELAAKCVKEIVEEQVDLQGEVCFEVMVLILGENEQVQSLEGPYFKVHVNVS